MPALNCSELDTLNADAVLRKGGFKWSAVFTMPITSDFEFCEIEMLENERMNCYTTIKGIVQNRIQEQRLGGCPWNRGFLFLISFQHKW